MDRRALSEQWRCKRGDRRTAALLLALACPAALPANPASGSTARDKGGVLEEVTVAATPLGGLELPLDRIAGNVQRATNRQIDVVHSASLAQFLDRRLGSVFINEVQGNPLQPDVQFRGFVASPLLGQPQGVSVYQDGVRINDPFGDVVNWALVPDTAIASIDLIPGSNPIFGLNTLGGALSLRTKNGFTHPGANAELTAGAHGRLMAEVESGGCATQGVSYYASARYLTEDGWRDFSPSDAVQVFSDLSLRSDTAQLDLTVTLVEAEVVGNGPAPIQLLALERESIYTHPDRTENSLAFVTLGGGLTLAPAQNLHALAWFRRSDIDTLNGDESLFEACDADPAFVCQEEGDEYTLDPGGNRIAFTPEVDGAALNRSRTQQDAYGASLQYGVGRLLARRDNRLVLGGSIERSEIAFSSSTELARFDAQRGTVASGQRAAHSFVGLGARMNHASAFFTNTLALTPQFDVTLSGRYSDASIDLADRIGVALNGNHDYSRFNGAAGFAYRPSREFRLYANYSESNRVPSPVELTCADPDAPCALPNAFLSDPPLEQVVARTLEAGAGGGVSALRWHAGLFRTTNANDILFINAGLLTNSGYFDNVGETRRQGVEINLNGRMLDERLGWFAHYTRLDAQFRRSFQVTSPHNPQATDGVIDVRRGARIPGTPRDLLKAGVSLELTSSVSINVDLLHQSTQVLRGDESNVTAPLAGFTVFNAGMEWRLRPDVLVFLQIDNLADKDYATFGLYGDPSEVLGDDFDDPRFISPGAPRSAWLGVRWTR